MIELVNTYLNSPLVWGLFIICGILIGMAKTGLSGAGLMIVPIMANIFGGKLSVGIVLPLLIFADLFAVNYYHRHANWRYILMALPWAIIGVALATVYGNNIDDNQFKTIIGIVILLGIVLMLLQDFHLKNVSVPDKWWFAAVLGLAGGFTTMIGNAAGPIMSLYLLSMRLPKNIFIGTAAWFFLIINLIKVPFHIFIWKTISADTLLVNLLAIPSILIGVFLGITLVKLFPKKFIGILLLVVHSYLQYFYFKIKYIYYK